MREVVDVLVRALVDDPDAVEVVEQPGRPGTVTVKVYVSPKDAGKVIGRNGRIAAAIRTVANAAAARHQLRAVVDINP